MILDIENYSYQEWRVAMLNYIDHLEIEEINYVECHNKTDEVFVLLEGTCHLIVFKDNKFSFTKLEKNKIYNVPLGIYHNHVLSNDAKVLIIEQEDTNDDNSSRIYLNDDVRRQLIKEWELYNELIIWADYFEKMVYQIKKFGNMKQVDMVLVIMKINIIQID